MLARIGCNLQDFALQPCRRRLRLLLLVLVCLCGAPAGLEASALRLEIADDLDSESLRDAIARSLQYLKKLPPHAILGEQPRRFTAKRALDSLVAFEKTLERRSCPRCWAKEIAARFDLIPSSEDPARATVLFTGYFQPVLQASLFPTAEYRYPIYAKPSDLILGEQVTVGARPSVEKIAGRLEDERFVPYYSRREIDDFGVLRDRGFEIAWVNDPIELFFLHIQGSGILQLEDGRRLQIGYAASNGRPYRSIGRLLIDAGKIPKAEMSMERLRRYLLERPVELAEVLAHNESYTFFRFLESGPLGSLEVELTPGRSIATDSRIFPKGALALIVTQKPVVDAAGRLLGWEPMTRFVLNQDTGAAIRGPQRADIFFGAGQRAGGQAGFMNTPGRLYFLDLKGKTVPASHAR
ncbi:MAG TPA: MltA domain-containing protein [Candidatus Eisenbacteria bacterium]|nr:MltA domain-containing protein [Candidatus Eisenbacteria bacterium]